jgi:ABC-type multidrug transport system fused ATPase/permease subunit
MLGNYPKNYRELIARYLLPQWPRVLLLLALMAADITLKLVNPQLLRSFIDTVSTAGFTSTLTIVAGLFIGTAILQQVVQVVNTYVGEVVGWNATNSLRLDLTRHLVDLDMTFYKTNTPGKLIERVDGDITAMANFFSRFMTLVLSNLVLIVGVLVVLTVQSWQAGLIIGLFIALSLTTMLCLRNIAVTPWKTFRQASADLFGFLEERIGGTEDIRASGAQAYVMRRFYQYARKRMQSNRIARLISMPIWGTMFTVQAAGNFLAFVLIIWLYGGGTISLGLAYLIFYYVNLITQPVIIITEQMDELQKATAGFARVKELFKVESQITDGPGVEFGQGALDVVFDHVSFGYNEESMVLKDVNFTLKPGEVLGLLGRTGSGKTTITRLLLRLYDPASGALRLGGHDLRDAKLDELREMIGMVTQNVQLFQASIRDNLSFFDKSISDERILEALNEMGMLPWLKRLPDGLDTMLAAGGSGLSAGEGQLLAFARVFLKNPAIVVLDEASSRLDPATESMLEHAVERLLRGRTGIIIAHRLKTVQRADTIMLMEQGEISEYGSRDRLLKDSTSRFAQLLQTAHEEVLV